MKHVFLDKIESHADYMDITDHSSGMRQFLPAQQVRNPSRPAFTCPATTFVQFGLS